MNRIARRQFLQAGAALVVGFAFAPTLPALAQLAPAGKSVAGDAVDSFLVVAPDGLCYMIGQPQE